MSMGTYPLATRAYPKDRDPEFAQYYSQARIGISRALINANIPFEYVSEGDLEGGLAGRYKVIYLPSMIGLSQKTLEILRTYVESGGTLIADMPLLLCDDFGKLNKWEKGSTPERLLGFQIADFYHSFNNPIILKGKSIEGIFGDIKVTSAKTLDTFQNGKPALLLNTLGKGKVLFINTEAMRGVFKPGNTQLEKILSGAPEKYLGVKPSFTATGDAIVLRRSSPKSDHYFLLNEAEKPVTTTLKSPVYNYSKSFSVLNEGSPIKELNGGIQVTLAPKSSVWIRTYKTPK
jgi:beta-galactosidase